MGSADHPDEATGVGLSPARRPRRRIWEIEPVGTSCRLTVVRDELKEGANDQPYGGWPMILSALKTLLETGEHRDTPARLRTAVRLPAGTAYC